MTGQDEQPTVAGTPEVVLACADCGEVGPIAGTRSVPIAPGQVNPVPVPDEPLCQTDFEIHARVWGSDRLHLLGPAVDTDDDGTVWVRRTCPRCNGAGKIEPYRGTCFECWGHRWTYVSPKGVRRTARWWATYQANRTPPGV